MFEYAARNVAAPLVLRLGLAVIFVFHGLGKVKDTTGWGTAWAGESLPAPLQAAVAYGEVLGGIALGFGFLTRLAALGIIAIMVGAIATIHWPYFGLRDGPQPGPGGFEYCFALAAMAAAVVLLGPGPISFDRFMFAPRRRA